MQALINCLEFIKGNFEREGERNFIMEVRVVLFIEDICMMTQYSCFN